MAFELGLRLARELKAGSLAVMSDRVHKCIHRGLDRPLVRGTTLASAQENHADSDNDGEDDPGGRLVRHRPPSIRRSQGRV